MKRILILGGGTAGTMMAAKLRRALDEGEWRITVVDRDDRHVYQPGLLFVPFELYGADEIVKPRRRFIPGGVELVLGEIDVIDAGENRVRMQDGPVLEYDFLVIATGSRIDPTETEGLAGEGWRETALDFYTLEGAAALQRALRDWDGGRLVLNVVEMPIKCPVAPLEFAFLADWYFTERGIRDRVDLVYATPLTGAFTQPRASDVLSGLLEEKGVRVETQFNAGSVDGSRRVLSSWDGIELEYDLLVTIPVHKGSTAIERSGLGNELEFVPTDNHTLLAEGFDNVFVLGDATNLPTSKAGSVAHFQAEVLIENVLRAIDGRPLVAGFDGHANCFIETGFGKAVLIDFNYDVEPLPGMFPLPGVGPFTLLGESELNHWGKLAFRYTYWHQLLRGAELPGIHTSLQMEGKRS